MQYTKLLPKRSQKQHSQDQCSDFSALSSRRAQLIALCATSKILFRWCVQIAKYQDMPPSGRLPAHYSTKVHEANQPRHLSPVLPRRDWRQSSFPAYMWCTKISAGKVSAPYTRFDPDVMEIHTLNPTSIPGVETITRDNIFALHLARTTIVKNVDLKYYFNTCLVIACGCKSVQSLYLYLKVFSLNCGSLLTLPI